MPSRLYGEVDYLMCMMKNLIFFAILRADVTQDEVSCNKFLDKYKDYERAHLARVKKLSKKNFGSLLDRIK